MSSKSTNKATGEVMILISWGHGRRRTRVRMGNVSADTVAVFVREIAELEEAKKANRQMQPGTATWLRKLDEHWKRKLVNAGLINRSELATSLVQLLEADDSVNGANISGSTVNCRRALRTNLMDYFRENCSIGEISPSRADEFRKWMNTQSLRTTTIDRRLSEAKRIFNTAVSLGFIEDNPFAHMHRMQRKSKEYDFISDEVVEKLIGFCVTHENKLLIVLPRYCGLLCPSEWRELRWSDVDFERNQITVSGRLGTRITRLQYRARLHLLDASKDGVQSSDFVVASRACRNGNAACRQRILRIIKKAGVREWPSMFTALKRSCEIQLRQDGCDAELAARWMGRSPQVLREFIIQSDPADRRQTA